MLVFAQVLAGDGNGSSFLIVFFLFVFFIIRCKEKGMNMFLTDFFFFRQVRVSSKLSLQKIHEFVF